MKTVAILLSGALVSTAIVAVRRNAGRAGSSLPAARTDGAAPLQRGQRIPDAKLVDQDGRPFRVSDLRGETLVVSFLYTRCDMPTMCPMTASKLVAAQRELRARGLHGVRFLVVSFDPRDTPASLKAFGARYRPDYSSFALATGSPEQVAALSRALGTYYLAGRGGEIEHNIAVSVIDADGILRYDLFGGDWDVSELARALRPLAGRGAPRPVAARHGEGRDRLAR